MNIISFAWTVDALLAGRKTVTRRDWPDKYAQQFRPGNLVQAYDRSPRNGGKCRAIIRLEDVRRDPLSRLTSDPSYGRSELINEGGLWPSVTAFLALLGAPKHGDPYRIQFALIEIADRQTSLPLLDPVPGVHAEFCQLTEQKLKLSIFQAHWKELLHTNGFTPADVATVARYLVRQVKQGKRQEGCLKIPNFANPINFASDLPLATKALPPAKPAAPKPAAVITLALEDLARDVPTRLAALRASLRRPKS